MSKMRNIAAILGRTEATNVDNSPGVDLDDNVADSSVVSSILAGSTMAVYSSVDSLPGSPTAGGQAFVTGNQRLYTARNSAVGSGWYNVALINATPTLSLSSTGTIALTPGSATTITMTAADSDNSNASLTLSLESGGDLFKFATVSRDSSVVTITPRTEDSATTLGYDGSATLTFKASDGVSQATVQNTFTLSFGPDWSATPTESIIYSSDIQAYDFFGYSVSMSSGGAYAIIGAYYEESNADDAGAAYIFSRSGSTWSQQAKIQHSDPQADDWFGRSVSISSDGSYAIVGAEREDTGASNAGAAYIFVRSGTSWSQQAKIQASDASTTANAQFGYSVSISGDGSYAIVGSHRWNGSTWAGAAYIYVRSGTSWTQQQQIQASDAASSDLYGTAVSMNSDGTYVAVGSPGDDGTSGDGNRGAVYVYTRSGTTWSQQAKIQHSDSVYNDAFGSSVSINSDATYIAAGASTHTGFDYGAGYIFTRSGSTWSQQAKIQSSDVQSNDNFGSGISISSDGSHAIVGAWGDDTAAGADQAGAAYIFSRDGTSWTQTRKIQASDIQPGDEFGRSVSMSGNGIYVIAGASHEDTGGNPNSGAAYIYESG